MNRSFYKKWYYIFMNLQYIDIHSHLNLSPLSENQEVILAKMQELNVGTITVGTDMNTSKMAIEIAKANSGSKESILRYETLGTQNGVTLLRVVLLTGRGHQIRAQLAAAGTPILGDIKYNMQKQRRVAGIALFASELGFVHPTTKEHLTFSAQPQALYPWTLFPDTARGKA
jgi:23S rRNA-/tRNA-specific pseudouridylate synthase